MRVNWQPCLEFSSGKMHTQSLGRSSSCANNCMRSASASGLPRSLLCKGSLYILLILSFLPVSQWRSFTLLLSALSRKLLLTLPHRCRRVTIKRGRSPSSPRKLHSQSRKSPPLAPISSLYVCIRQSYFRLLSRVPILLSGGTKLNSRAQGLCL